MIPGLKLCLIACILRKGLYSQSQNLVISSYKITNKIPKMKINYILSGSHGSFKTGKLIVSFFAAFLIGIASYAQTAILGLTNLGGATGVGIMFKIDTSSAPILTDEHDFTYISSINPQGSLIKGSNGLLFGMAKTAGGILGDSGTIFSYNVTTSVFTNLYFFTRPTGDHPSGSLVEVNGTLYGMTHDGGANGLGVIFKYNLTTKTYTDIHDFALATGSNPYGSLVFSNGKLYGMTNLGGAKDSGVIFSIDTVTYTYADKIDLTGKTGGKPYGTIVITPSGNFLALTNVGGAHDSGTVLLYNPIGNTVTDEYNFTKSAGGMPGGNLTWGGSKLYGLTNYGGTHDSGVVFSLDPVTYSYTDIYNFTKSSGTLPEGTLILSSYGDLYGMTSKGGTNNFGVIFRLDTSTYTFEKLLNFAGSSNGRAPAFTQLLEVCVPPIITMESTNAAICANGDTSFTVTATASAPVTYQWEVNTGTGFTDLTSTGMYSGATSQTLKLTGATSVMNGYVYRCVTMDGCDDSTLSNYDTLTVHSVSVNISGNVIGGMSICMGMTDTLKANATGSSPFTYSWSTSKTNSTIYATTAGGYTVVVKDKFGCADSNMATVTVNSLPTITITSSSLNDTVCKSTAVTLTGNGAVSYTWNNGITNASPFPASISGKYTVTGTDSHGCKNKDSINLVVDTVKVSLHGNTIGNFTICGGGQDTLTATTSSGLGKLSYAWNTTGTNDTIIASFAATYSVQVTDAYGCMGNGSANVSVNANPTITITSNPANDTVCMGGSIRLGGNGALSYSWSGGITNGLAFVPPSSANYVVTGTDSHGCKGKDSVNIGVMPLPSITITSSLSKDTVCQSTMVTLNGNGATSYTWNNGITDAIPFAASISGEYVVTGTDSHGCKNKDSLNLVVDTVMVSLHGNTIGNFNICGGGNDTITATTTSGLGALTYAWSTSGTNDTIIVNTQAIYSVQVTDAYGCMGDASAKVRVRPNPTITVTSTPVNDTVCMGDSVTLSGSGAVSYSWSGGITNGVAFAPASSGEYIVTGTDSHGCEGTDTVKVGVNALPSVTVTGVSPINPGTSDTLTASGTSVSYAWTTGSSADTTIVTPTVTTTYTVTGTGTNGCTDTASFTVVVKVITAVKNIVSNNNTVAYPNPATTTIYLAFSTNSTNVPATIEIADITGRTLSYTNTTLSNGKTLPVDINGLAQGIYFVKVVTDKNTEIVKFIKQ